MSDRGEEFIYDGINGLTCEAFVRLVRQSALGQDRHKDDEWIASYAASRLDGPVLHWYEGLPDEFQENWKLLRRAILAEFGSSGKAIASPSIEASSSVHRNSSARNSTTTIIPTPAAAPPAASAPPAVAPIVSAPKRAGLNTTNRTGRIRVVASDGRLLGYLAAKLVFKGHVGRTQAESEALRVQFTSNSSGLDECIIIDSPPRPNGRQQLLGITWGWKQSNPKPLFTGLLDGDESWGGLVVLMRSSNSKTAFESSSEHYHGMSGSAIWQVLLDGSLVLAWEMKPHVQYNLDLIF